MSGRLKNFFTKGGVITPRILKNPEPFVIFRDFGASSLDFTLFYWIDMTKMTSTMKVGSDLRFHIVSLFDESSIVIAVRGKSPVTESPPADNGAGQKRENCETEKRGADGG